MMRAFIQYAVAGLVAVTPVFASPVEPRLVAHEHKQKTPVDAATYANLLRYPAYSTFANELKDSKCINPPYGSVVEAYIDEPDTDTQLAIFRNDADLELVVTMPGSHSMRDYITDFSFVTVPYEAPDLVCDRCRVHAGFLHAWNSIAERSRRALDDLRARHPDHAVVVTGKSLGGALAQLAYTGLAAAGVPVKAAYTFGQPRVGNRRVADYVDSLAGATGGARPGVYHRVTHADDGVPHLPPDWLDVFRHPGTEYWESGDRLALESTYRCYGQEPADCNKQTPGFLPNRAHRGYATEHYECKTA